MQLGVLISGRGSNLVTILMAAAEGRPGARGAPVTANRPPAAGPAHARAHGVPTAVAAIDEGPDETSSTACVLADEHGHSFAPRRLAYGELHTDGRRVHRGLP